VRPATKIIRIKSLIGVSPGVMNRKWPPPFESGAPWQWT